LSIMIVGALGVAALTFTQPPITVLADIVALYAHYSPMFRALGAAGLQPVARARGNYQDVGL